MFALQNLEKGGLLKANKSSKVSCCTVLQCVAVWCSMSQLSLLEANKSSAVRCCSVLQYVAACCKKVFSRPTSFPMSVVAVCCRIKQCAAANNRQVFSRPTDRVMQVVAECCSVCFPFCRSIFGLFVFGVSFLCLSLVGRILWGSLSCKLFSNSLSLFFFSVGLQVSYSQVSV